MNPPPAGSVVLHPAPNVHQCVIAHHAQSGTGQQVIAYPTQCLQDVTRLQPPFSLSSSDMEVGQQRSVHNFQLHT